jgi:hypothetical protein
MCSSRSEIPVTAAKYRSTVHPHESQQRSTTVGQERLAPLVDVSPWDGHLIPPENRSDWRPPINSRQRLQSPGTVRGIPSLRRKKTRRYPIPRIQLSSHLPSMPTEVDDLLPTTMDADPPLSPSLGYGVSWHSSGRSCTSAVSAIIPTKG